VIWFVDLTKSPRVPIVDRCVRSSAPEVSAINCRNEQRNHNRIIPDDTEARFWVRAQSRREALAIARGRVR